jgi:CRP-like cAMP-binding protein
VDHLYVVGEGLVATNDVDGTLLLHRPGEPVALRAMIDGERLPGDIVAVTEAEIWTMRRRDFMGACQDVPGFALGLLLGQARTAQTA